MDKRAAITIGISKYLTELLVGVETRLAIQYETRATSNFKHW